MTEVTHQNAAAPAPALPEGWRDYFTREPELRPFTAVDRVSRKEFPATACDFMGAGQHYSKSFGTQWTKYRDVQIDRCNGTTLSYEHLKMFLQDDLEPLRNAVCLEIGSGAGRFTDYLVDLCKTVITVDPSSALLVNAAHGAGNLIPCHADLFDVPVDRTKIDVVFCRGVTQHTEDPRKAILRLFDYVKPGGWVFFDVYHKKWFRPFMVKYWLRPITRRVPHDRLTRFAERVVPPMLRLKNAIVNPLLPKNKWGQNIAAQLVPVADYTGNPQIKSYEEKVTWSVLDTVDMYTPRYDIPMSWDEIMATLREARAENIQGNWSTFCFRATAPQ